MSGPPDANLEEARRWLQQARMDLATARWLGQGRFWAQACFYCQQAAETALKAVLICAGEENPRTHSTTRLIKRAVSYGPDFARFSKDAPLLDRHYVGTRYPNGVSVDQSQMWEEKDFCEAEVAASGIVDIASHAIPTT
jgi:HEPN domain-containing protein